MFEGIGAAGSALGTGLGGFLGHALGGLGDVLSAPARGLRTMLGMPETGGHFTEGLGLEPDTLATSAVGMGYDMLTDPLTYLGGFAGKLGGRLLGTAVGSNLERSALARGPRFGGGLSKLSGAVGTDAAGAAERLAASPHAARLLEELPEGSNLMSGSNNALAFRTPAGDVMRYGTEARPAIPEMLQPTRRVSAGDWHAERLPFADRVGDRGLFAEQYKPMTASIRAQGLHPADFHPGNLGTVGDQALLIDPGAVVARPGAHLPTASSIQAAEPGRLSNWLLDRLDATNRVRNRLAPPVGAEEPTNALASRLGALLGFSG